MYSNAFSTSLDSHPKYQLLRQRGHTPQQIQSMLQRRLTHKQQHLQPSARVGSTPPQHSLPAPPQPPSIDQSVMFSFQNASNERRIHHTKQKMVHPEYVPPRANIQLQFKPDKSSIESILQDAYERRQTDVFVPPARTGLLQSSQLSHSQVHCDQQRHQYKKKTHTSHSQIPHKQPATAVVTPDHSNASSQPNQNPMRAQQRRRKQFEAELGAMHNQENTAYELLNVSEGYTLRELAKKYRKQALKYHPDRLAKHTEFITHAQKEQCKAMFEQITKAYLYLVEQHSLRESDKPFYELRDQSRNDVEEQQENTSSGTKVRLMDGDQFDVELFNKLYDDNRLHEPTDDGYGDWLTAKPEEDTSELFSNKFNVNVFNTTFDQLKRDNPHSERQLAKRDELGMVVRGNTTAFSTLGEGRVGDFGGATGDLQYSDLKDAHTTNATLIDTSRAQQQPQFHSVKEMEAQRSQVRHTLSPAEAERQSFLKEKREKEEHARRERLEQRDQMIAQQHQRIQQQLLQ